MFFFTETCPCVDTDNISRSLQPQNWFEQIINLIYVTVETTWCLRTCFKGSLSYGKTFSQNPCRVEFANLKRFWILDPKQFWDNPKTFSHPIQARQDCRWTMWSEYWRIRRGTTCGALEFGLDCIQDGFARVRQFDTGDREMDEQIRFD